MVDGGGNQETNRLRHHRPVCLSRWLVERRDRAVSEGVPTAHTSPDCLPRVGRFGGGQSRLDPFEKGERQKALVVEHQVADHANVC